MCAVTSASFSTPGSLQEEEWRARRNVSPLSGLPKTSASPGTYELESHISVTGQERAIEVELVNELASTAFPGSSLYHQRASITQIHPWFVWAKGQPYWIQAASLVQPVEEGEREGRGHKTMPQGRTQPESQDWSRDPVMSSLF